MALGRAGTPRKLGVPGEDLPHVLYRLIEADHYTNNNILVVGGGDSAVEAAMGLAHQPGNKVTLSYRKGEFSRLKDRNTKRIEEHIKSKKVEVLFNSMPTEFRKGSVLIDVRRSDQRNAQRLCVDLCRWNPAHRVPQSDGHLVRRRGCIGPHGMTPGSDTHRWWSSAFRSAHWLNRRVNA